MYLQMRYRVHVPDFSISCRWPVTHTSAWNWHAVKGHFFGAAKAISAAVSRACSRSNIRRHVHWMLWHLLQGQVKGATRSAMHSIWFNTWTKFQNIFKLFSCLNYPRYCLLLLWTDTDHNFDIAHPDSWKKAQCNQSTILVKLNGSLFGGFLSHRGSPSHHRFQY